MFKQPFIRFAVSAGICTAIGLSLLSTPQASAATDKLVIGTAVHIDPTYATLAASAVKQSEADSVAADASAAKTAFTSKVEQLIGIGKQYLGVKYQYGAKAGTAAFDCSSYTQYIFKQIGISLPRTSASQATLGVKVSKANLKAGDLVFFKRPGVSGIGHVAIYIGDDKMIGASGNKVQISSMNTNYWMKNYVTARRVL